MTLGVRGVVEQADGRVLLVRHVYTPGWYLPGGGVERGEPARLALERELEEEAGVALVDPPILIGVFSNHRVFPNDHVILYQIPFGMWESCESNSAGEIAEVGWFDPTNLPPDATPGTRRRLAALTNSPNLDDYW